MADVDATSWSATAGDNTTIDDGSGGSVAIAGTDAPSNFDDGLRSVMAGVALTYGKMLSGSTRPSNVRVNSLWVDTSGGATANVVKFYDGTDDISVVTIDTTANTSAPDFINDLTEVSGLATGDMFPVYDASATAQRKVQYVNLFSSLSALTELNAATIALSDVLAGSDISGNAGRKVTVETILSAMNLLTEETSIDNAADFVPIYDVSAGALRKAKPQNFGITRQAQSAATNSGTTVDITGITSGAKSLAIHLAGVSTSGTDDILLQLGDSGGIETSGYTGSTNEPGSGGLSWSAGAILTVNMTATNGYHGILHLELVDTNTWAIGGAITQTGTIRSNDVAGTKTLTGELTQVRLTTVSGTDTFDAGNYYAIARDG